MTQVEAQSARLYALLQQSVDQQIQQVGFLPESNTYGSDYSAHANGDGHPSVQPKLSDTWVCSDKQKALVLSLVEQHGLDKQDVEALAKEMFGLPVKTLNRLQASGLIEELLERHGKGTNGHVRTAHRRTRS